MRMRKLGDKTLAAYIRAVRGLAAFLGRSPDSATVEDLRRFQLHLDTSPLKSRFLALDCLSIWEQVAFDHLRLLCAAKSLNIARRCLRSARRTYSH
jgi:hypothetical protein